MYKILLVVAVLTVTLISKASNPDEKLVKIKYDGKIAIKTLQTNLRYVLNRKYFFKKIPKKLLFFKVTIMNGGAKKPIEAKIPANTVLYICLDSGKKIKENDIDEYAKNLKRKGWRTAGKITTSDKRMKYVRVYMKKFSKDATEEFLGVGFPGVMVLAKYMELEKK